MEAAAPTHNAPASARRVESFQKPACRFICRSFRESFVIHGSGPMFGSPMKTAVFPLAGSKDFDRDLEGLVGTRQDAEDRTHLDPVLGSTRVERQVEEHGLPRVDRLYVAPQDRAGRIHEQHLDLDRPDSRIPDVDHVDAGDLIAGQTEHAAAPTSARRARIHGGGRRDR